MKERWVFLEDCDSLEKGDHIRFVYAGGNHPGEERELIVADIHSSGPTVIHFGGQETKVANGEYRRFSTNKLSYVELLVNTDYDNSNTPSLADVLGVEPHEVEIFKAVLQKMLEKIKETT